MKRLAQQHPAVLASFWMMGTLVSFMAMAVGGRGLKHLGTFEILFFRSSIGLLIVLALLARFGWRHARTTRPGLQVLRNIAHYGGQFGWFTGIALIPLAEVFAIEFTQPIWIALLAAVFLGERLTRPRLLAIVLGFIGMLIILRPGFAAILPGHLAVIGAALGYAISLTLTRNLARVDGPLAVLFYMTVVQLPLGLVPALFDWVPPAARDWPWLVVVGVTALSAHYCIARAMKLADATVVVPMDFLRMPLIAAVGYLWYDEGIDWFVMTGALVMLFGNYQNIRAESRR
jgi:drug/metabolite transporter (DMT)-like permease